MIYELFTIEFGNLGIPLTYKDQTKLDLPFLDKYVVSIIREYAQDIVILQRFITITPTMCPLKDVVMLNGNIILEMITTTPKYTLIIYPEAAQLDFTQFSPIIKSLSEYQENDFLICPYACKGHLPFPSSLLFHKNTQVLTNHEEPHGLPSSSLEHAFLYHTC